MIWQLFGIRSYELKRWNFVISVKVRLHQPIFRTDSGTMDLSHQQWPDEFVFRFIFDSHIKYIFERWRTHHVIDVTVSFAEREQRLRS